MLPIPALQIKGAELEYTIKVISTETNVASKDQVLQDLNLIDTALVDRPAVMRASLASEAGNRRNRSLDMLVKMKVTVEQSDIPAGLAKFLNYAGESIQTKRLESDSESESD